MSSVRLRRLVPMAAAALVVTVTACGNADGSTSSAAVTAVPGSTVAVADAVTTVAVTTVPLTTAAVTTVPVTTVPVTTVPVTTVPVTTVPATLATLAASTTIGAPPATESTVIADDELDRIEQTLDEIDAILAALKSDMAQD